MENKFFPPPGCLHSWHCLQQMSSCLRMAMVKGLLCTDRKHDSLPHASLPLNQGHTSLETRESSHMAWSQQSNMLSHIPWPQHLAAILLESMRHLSFFHMNFYTNGNFLIKGEEKCLCFFNFCWWLLSLSPGCSLKLFTWLALGVITIIFHWWFFC